MPDYTRSPFPGMDPWMEFRWGDTHSSLAFVARTSLNEILPPDLYATSEERIILDPATRQLGRPDVFVVRDDRHPGQPLGASPRGGVATAPAVAEPLTLTIQRPAVDSDPLTEPYLAVRDLSEALVTTIEWVSPTNKTDPTALRQFHSKRGRVLRRGANAVEIDLTRDGNPGGRRRLLRPLEVPPDQESAYVAVARRGSDPDRAEVYALALRDRLPVIAIPLRPSDTDVPLDLQSLVDEVWRTGRYWATDYSRPLDPPLSPTDAAWAAERVAAWRAS